MRRINEKEEKLTKRKNEKKSGEKNNLKKEKLIIFVALLGISFLIFIPWLKGHYSLDDYTIASQGYDEYANYWSLKDGRLFQFLWLKFASLIRMPVNVFINLNIVLGIIISNISVILIYNTVLKKRRNIKVVSKILLILVSYITIFNFTFIDCMYYVESTVMAISIFLCIFSSIKFTNGNALNKKSILFSSLLTLIAVFCYQGTVCVYITFTYFMLLLEKSDYKKVIAKLVECLLIAGTSILLNYAFMNLALNMLHVSQNRIGSIKDIKNNLLFMKKNTPAILVNSCTLYPKYLLLGILGATYAICAMKLNTKEFFKLILLSFIALASSSIFFIVTKTSFDCGRMRISLGMLIGLMYLIIIDRDLDYAHFDENNKEYENNNKDNINNKIDKDCKNNKNNNANKDNKSKYIMEITKSVQIFTILVYITSTIISYEIIMTEQRKVNMLEEKEAKEIYEYVKEYEKEKKVKVKRYVEVIDQSNYSKCFYKQIKTKVNSMNASGIRHYKISYSTIKFYTGMDLEYEKPVMKNIIEINNEKGYECIGDTLYVKIYRV